MTFTRVRPSDGGCRPVVAQRLTRGGRTHGSQWGRGAQQGSGCGWGAGRGVGPALPRGCGFGGGTPVVGICCPQPMTAPRCCLWDKHPSLPTHLDKAGKCSHEDLSQGPPPGSHPTSLQTMVTELTTGACLGLRDPHPHEGGPAAPRPEEGLRHPPSPRPNRVPEKGNCCHLYPSILAPMPFLSGEPGALSQMGNHGLQGSRRPGPPGGMGEPPLGRRNS